MKIYCHFKKNSTVHVEYNKRMNKNSLVFCCFESGLHVMLKAKITENIDYFCRGGSWISSQGGRKIMGMEIYFYSIVAIFENTDFKNLNINL